MRIAITGATGFIGKRLCHTLVERGDQVIALTRDPERAKRVLPPSAEFVSWEPLTKPGRNITNIHPEVLIHLAGETISGRWSETRKKEIYESRIHSMRALIVGLEEIDIRPRALVCGSAISYYGDRGDEILDEESSPGHDFLARVCRDWESEAMKAESLGIRVVRVRTGLILGPGGGALQAMLLPFRLGLGGPMGSGRQWMSWIHLDDEVGLILHAIDCEDIEGPLNATAPEPATNREFVRSLGAVLKRPAILPLPAFALRLVLGETSLLLLGGQRVLPAKALATGYRFKYTSLKEALVSCLR